MSGSGRTRPNIERTSGYPGSNSLFLHPLSCNAMWHARCYALLRSGEEWSMQPDLLDELDDEIRGQVARSIKERIERGENPEAARRASLKEFGNGARTRKAVRRFWRPRWLEAAPALGRGLGFA